nr:hypothetical protein [Tanacetum cinerariifolium]GFA72024.1 hypothetical protein [Tanacetum cinerariifolium]
MLGLEHPPSHDYVPGPEYPEYVAPTNDDIPVEDQPLLVDASPTALSPGYVDDSDPSKEDPEKDVADYPADRRADEEEEEESSKDDEEDASPIALSLGYVVDSDPEDPEEDPIDYPINGGDNDKDDEDDPSNDNDEEDEAFEEDEDKEEEHLALYLAPSNDEVTIKDQPLPVDDSPTTLSSGYVVESNSKEDPEEDPEEDPTNYPANRRDNDDDEEEEEEEDEEASKEDEDEKVEYLALVDSAAPTPSAPRSPQTKVPFSETRICRVRKTVRLSPPMVAFTEALIAEFSSAHTPPSPPPSLLSSWSSPLLQIPSPPLPWVFDDEPEASEEAPQPLEQAPPSLDYVPGLEHPPSPDYVPGPEYLV